MLATNAHELTARRIRLNCRKSVNEECFLYRRLNAHHFFQAQNGDITLRFRYDTPSTSWKLEATELYHTSPWSRDVLLREVIIEWRKAVSTDG
jgi:hypothetical protein